jgi:hypothetical protein
MQITLEKLQQRKVALIRDADRIAAELERGKEVLNATRGAIQDCIFWEAQLGAESGASANSTSESPVDTPRQPGGEKLSETPRRRFEPVREVPGPPSDRPPNRVGQNDQPST